MEPDDLVKAQLLDATDLGRTLDRMACQLVEHIVPGTDPSQTLALVGMQTRGVHLARRIRDRVLGMDGFDVPLGVLDATMYRDDFRRRLKQPVVRETRIPFDITERQVFLVDDVLYTGRTVRAALDALMDIGRPSAVHFMVIIDRGLQELPIRADIVGRSVPTLPGEEVRVRLMEGDDREGVWLVSNTEGTRHDMTPGPTQESGRPEGTTLDHRHMLGLETYSAREIRLVLDTAREFREVLDRPIRRVPTLRGVTVVNLFFEPSTRTRISFELAEKRLSADTVNFASSGSSVSKGETLKDTAQNIEAMKIDVVVVRHSSPGAPHFLTQCVDAVVINAGDGAHEHPTQGLLDALTISDRFPDLNGLRVSIIGDLMYSRVVRSNLYALSALGAEVTLCGPPTLIPPNIADLAPGRVRITHRLDEALEGCDVAMALRIQLERIGRVLFPSLREYHERFGIKSEHMDRYPDLLVMHPGPVNRGVELASEVVDHERAVILNQVTNGVAVRMAVLYLLSGAAE